MVDETAFLKKGIHSAGVQRQYSGTAGRTENCQLGVFLVYATAWAPTYLDRDLYLPRNWTDDRERCRAAGIPDEVGFQTKPALAQQQLQRALDGQVPCAWVTADCVYGADPTLRRWLEGRPQTYVLAIRKDTYLAVAHPTGVWRESVQSLAARLPADAWQRLSVEAGSKGPRWYDWAQVPLAEPAPAGWALWLLVRRSLGERPELAYYRVFAPAPTTLAEQVRVAGTRWTVEECFETGTDEVGLDHYEVRKWGSWYRHMTLALLAHAYLAVLRAHAVATPAEKGAHGGSGPVAANAAGGAAPRLAAGVAAAQRTGAGTALVALAPVPSGPRPARSLSRSRRYPTRTAARGLRHTRGYAPPRIHRRGWLARHASRFSGVGARPRTPVPERGRRTTTRVQPGATTRPRRRSLRSRPRGCRRPRALRWQPSARV
jgi:SRSO17 transposase